MKGGDNLQVVRSKKKIYPNGMQKIYVYNETHLVGYEKTEPNAVGSKIDLSIEEQEEIRELERKKKFFQSKEKIKDYCLSNDFDGSVAKF